MADPPFRCTIDTAPQAGIAKGEAQVAAISSEAACTSDVTVEFLVQVQPEQDEHSPQLYIDEQKNQKMAEIIEFLEGGISPYDVDRVPVVVLQKSSFAIVDQTLYYTIISRREVREE